jgi:hypothetical protein
LTAADRAYQAVAEAVFGQPSSEDCFNPYHGINLEVDRPDAPRIRQENLRSYFEACSVEPPLFLLAEAPGPWGCRFSGVPITSEAQLLDDTFPIEGRQSSIKEDPYTEYSAGIFWRLLVDHFPNFVVWNAFPLHPHHVNKPFSIRAPRQSELLRFGSVASKLIEIFRPGRVLAVGRKAERTLERLGIDATYVRHPSQGGANAFRAGVEKALAESYGGASGTQVRETGYRAHQQLLPGGGDAGGPAP